MFSQHPRLRHLHQGGDLLMSLSSLLPEQSHQRPRDGTSAAEVPQESSSVVRFTLHVYLQVLVVGHNVHPSQQNAEGVWGGSLSWRVLCSGSWPPLMQLTFFCGCRTSSETCSSFTAAATNYKRHIYKTNKERFF